MSFIRDFIERRRDLKKAREVLRTQPRYSSAWRSAILMLNLHGRKEEAQDWLNKDEATA